MNSRLFVLLILAWMLLVTSPAHAQALRFDLKSEKLDAPPGPWQVTRVLDLRADRSRLGTVHRGLGNALTSADFSQAMAPEVLSFLRAKMALRPGARPVLMRVFTLTLAEDLRPTSESAEAELMADFLEPQPDSTYRVLLAVGETTRRGGLDVTKFHPTNIALVLQQAMSKLAAVPAPPPTTEVLSRADALAGRGGAATQRFAIQAAAVPRRGFYRSIEEFRNNTPSEADAPFEFEHIEHAGKRWAGIEDVQAYYLRTDARHSRQLVNRSGLWGLSDGKEALIAYRGSFYKLLPGTDGRSYTFMGPPVFDEKAAASMTTAIVLGGALGGAIAGAANGTAPMVPYDVHLATGRVVPAQEATPTDADGFALAPDTARIFVYRRFDSAKDQVVSLTVSGQPAVALPAREWVALTWTSRRDELKVCVRAADGAETCQAFVPDFSQPTYLECAVPTGGGAPALRAVAPKEGAFEMRRIRMLKKAGR
ncbi:MAG: hypothetical protein JWR44_1603 [Hymenobacter sp.]|nr:hypothetical protein [Hymenobacter sp.]